MCAGTVAEILPPEVVIRVLKPLIQMAEYPVNQAAIKMLNKLVEAHQPSIVAAALPEIMPGLIKVCQIVLNDLSSKMDSQGSQEMKGLKLLAVRVYFIQMVGATGS